MAESLQDQIARQQADRKRELMRLALVEALREGMDRGDDQATIDSNLSRLKRILENQYKIPFSMADGGEMRKGVGSLNDTALNMFRGPKGIASLSKFASGGEVFIPTQEDLNKMAARVTRLYGFDPVEIALEEGVDPDLALRIMMRESSGDHSRGSKKGALGLMGLMPITAKDVNVDRTNPLENFLGGLRYLKKMQKRFGPVVGLAAYNAGPTAIEKYGGIPPFKETQDYVRTILTPHTGVNYEDEIQTDAETALMQMPVQIASDVLRPRARPGSGFVSPSFLFNTILGTEETKPVEGQVTRPRARPSMVAKYGLPGDMPQGIGTLNETARDMFR
tara:strand:- start:1368 stop:2372 length:1005 start_codon:yes stop_codon:yes gene_type:complete